MTSTHPDAQRVADTLLNLWADALETPEGRAVITQALCRAMRGVAGCGQCPMGTVTPEIRAAVEELRVCLERAGDHAEFLAVKVS